MKAPNTHVSIDQKTQMIVVVFPPPMPSLSLTAEEAEALAQILLAQAKFLKVQQSN